MTTNQEAREELVRQAARAGASEAIKANKLKLRVYSGLVGFVAATAVSLPTTLVLDQSTTSQARQQVSQLCRYQRQLVKVLGATPNSFPLLQDLPLIKCED